MVEENEKCILTTVIESVHDGHLNSTTIWLANGMVYNFGGSFYPSGTQILCLVRRANVVGVEGIKKNCPLSVPPRGALHYLSGITHGEKIILGSETTIHDAR